MAAVTLTIPPLSERGDDVLMLAESFLEKFSREFGKSGLKLTREAGERLATYRWPGNVRELQNTMERAVILSDGAGISAEALQLPSAQPAAESLPADMLPGNFSWEGSLEQVSERAVAPVERANMQTPLRESKS